MEGYNGEVVVVNPNAKKKVEKPGLVTNGGIKITMNYSFIRMIAELFPEELAKRSKLSIQQIQKLQTMSDKELSEMISNWPEETINDVFVAGICIGALVEQIEKDVTKEEVKEEPKEEPNAQKEKEKSKLWRLLPVIPIALVLLKCSMNVSPSESPIRDDDFGATSDTVIVGESIENIVDIVKAPDNIVIYAPKNPTHIEKALTDFGNQEQESNYRKEGISTDGQEMWNLENKAINGYQKNQECIDAIQELKAIALSQDSTPEDKMYALLDMLDHYRRLGESYNYEEVRGMQAYAEDASKQNEDAISDTEIKIAEGMVDQYTKDMQTTDHTLANLYTLSYMNSMGYKPTSMNITELPDGSISIGGLELKREGRGPELVPYYEVFKVVSEMLKRGEDPSNYVTNLAEEALADFAIDDLSTIEPFTLPQKTSAQQALDPAIWNRKPPRVHAGENGLRIDVEDIFNLAARRRIPQQALEDAIKRFGVDVRDTSPTTDGQEGQEY